MYLPLKQTYVGSSPTGPTKFQAMQQISCCALTNAVLRWNYPKKEYIMSAARINTGSVHTIGGGSGDISKDRIGGGSSDIGGGSSNINGGGSGC